MTKKEKSGPALQLGLFRHAKSSRDDSGTEDVARPLAPRGVEAARVMGRMMAERRLIPDLVLCSPAVRARETWALAAAQLPHLPALCETPELYDFGDGTVVLDAIRASGGDSPFLMVVGHNPAFQQLACRLATGENGHEARMAEKFPTAALALLDCPVSRWADLAEDSCTLTDFITPRDLPEA